MSILSLKISLKTALLSTSLALFTSACAPVDTQNQSSKFLDIDKKANTYNFLNAPSETKTITESTIRKPADLTSSNFLSSPKYLSDKELVRIFTDRTAYGKLNDKGGEWIEYTSADGRAIFLDRDGKISNGEWWVKNDQVCFAYSEFSDTSCNSIEKSGQKLQYVQNDGTKEFYITELKTGDSSDLATRFLIRQ